MKKMLFLLLIVISTFIVYKCTNNKKINYLSLGDDISLGYNSFNTIEYSYNDFVIDYFKNKYLLSYNNDFNKKGDTIQNLINNINNNIKMNNNSIRNVLNDSNYIIVSIGLNDIVNYLNYNGLKYSINHSIELYKKISKISYDYNNLIKTIKSKTGATIIMIGIYNPFLYDENYSLINIYFKKLNNNFYSVCKNNNVIYLDIINEFNNREYILNSNSLYPSYKGYKYISDKIIYTIEKNAKN